jgi:choline dehydrogenase-like flavoprotein
MQDGILRHAYLNRHYFEEDEKIADAYGVIITAGAIHTPKILLNSGIGPSSELLDMKIDVKYDSPYVGKNLQDHPTINVKFQVKLFENAGQYM